MIVLSEMKSKGFVVVAGILAILVATSCAGTERRVEAVAGAHVCTAVPDSTGLVTSLGRDARSGTIVLAKTTRGPLANKTIAFVADADGSAVLTVDVDARRVVATLALESPPSELLVLPDGRIAASLPKADAVTVLHPREDGGLVRGCDVRVSAEPRSLALAGERLLVSSGFGHAVEARSSADLSAVAKIEVAREPRQITVSDDGKRAFVTHAIGGIVSVIDLAAMRLHKTLTLTEAAPSGEDPVASLEGAVTKLTRREKVIPGKGGARAGVQGFAIVATRAPRGRILVPHTLVDPGDPESRPVGVGMASAAAIPAMGLIDAGALEVVSAGEVIPLPFFGGDSEEGRFVGSSAPDVPDCLLPRAATIDDATGTVLVACFGIDSVVAFDAASVAPMSVERARWNVAAGPTGIVVEPERRRAIVFSQFERALEILKLDEMDASSSSGAHDRVELPALGKPLTLPMLLGRQTFYATGDSRISITGLGCASCHVDGRDDGLTWATEEGPRRTKTAAGVAEATAPYGWDGKSATLEEHLQREFKRLRGRGLRNVHLDGLVSYVKSMWLPSPRASDADAALVSRGKALFESAARGCSSCHPGGGTDKKAHRIGSATVRDRRASFDSPALFGVASRSPYFHDGRFMTLEELLATHVDVVEEQSAEKASKPASPPLAGTPAVAWTPADREAIAAYLRSL